LEQMLPDVAPNSPFTAPEGDHYKALPSAPVGDEGNAQGFKTACVFILTIELVERLCYYTFAGSQEFFLEQLGYSVQQSAGLNSAFSTLCLLWPLAGGYVADAFWGRYKTIVRFASVYLVGTLVCALAVLPGDWRSGSAYLIGSMGLIAVGCGGIKPNISNFGADQYDVRTEAGKKAQEVFYTQFYVVINIGALASYGGMTTLCSNGGPFVPKAFGYFAAYSLGAIAMAFALLTFMCKSSTYRHKPPGGNLLRGVAKHLTSAARRGSWRATAVCIGVPSTIGGILTSVVFSFSPSTPSLLIALVGIAGGLTSIGWGCHGDLSWITKLARHDRGLGRHETSDFLRVLPTMISASLAFNALYNCSSFWFQQQACQMNLVVNGFQLSGSFFNVADCVAIVFLTPVILKHVNPALSRTFGGFSRHGKLMLGCALAAVSVFWSAYLEVSRRASPLLSEDSACAPKGVKMSSFSAWWMIGPYAVMGLAEVYVNPTLYYLSYSQTPPRLRSTAQAVCLVMGAASSGMFTLLTHLMGSANNLNDSHLEYGYFASASLSLVFVLCYLSVQGSLKEKDFHMPGEHVRDESDGEEEERGNLKEVAYSRIGFFKDFASPTPSLFGSPNASPNASPFASPVASPLNSPRGMDEDLDLGAADFKLVTED